VVQQFLSTYRPRVSAGNRMSIFREPAVPSGFPDLVAVTWREREAFAWTDARRKLSVNDLRLLHLLATSGPQPVERLAALSFMRLRSSLRLLSGLGLVRERRDRWSATPLRESFAVRAIISFEAKVSDWVGAIEQAWMNRWFASESYILLPRLPRSAAVLASATARGVGVWLAGSRRPLLKAQRSIERQPVSFASWLFNEWVCRAASQAGAGGIHDYCRLACDPVR
jgi:hypothetical protein